jgi:MYND finger
MDLGGLLGIPTLMNCGYYATPEAAAADSVSMGGERVSDGDLIHRAFISAPRLAEEQEKQGEQGLPPPPPPIQVGPVLWRRLQCAGCRTCTAHAHVDKLMKCGGCSCVRYCSRACQEKMWPEHKPFCKAVQAAPLRIRRRWYDPDEMEKQIAANPPKPLPKNATPKVRRGTCGLCEREDARVVQMECCGYWACDNESEYPLGSYSRAFCARSHRRYSRCGIHQDKKHAGSWRDCRRCVQEEERCLTFGNAAELNFMPPKNGSGSTEYCHVCPMCSKYFLFDYEDSALNSAGPYARKPICNSCTTKTMGPVNFGRGNPKRS